eukprot:1159649-Pelagomonas_calceolata.AAC.1
MKPSLLRSYCCKVCVQHGAYCAGGCLPELAAHTVSSRVSLNSAQHSSLNNLLDNAANVRTSFDCNPNTIDCAQLKELYVKNFSAKV